MNYLDSMPLVSVIVPVYNVEKYLVRCLDSIVGQTYRNLEIILVNDGSTDNSGEICRQYAERDARIRLFTQENQGLSAARNTGLDHMNGEYIVFVDSDDYISIHFVEIMLSKLLEYDVKIAICDRLEVSDADDSADVDHVSLPDIGPCIKMSRDDVFKGAYKSSKYVVAWEKIYHKEIFENLRFERGRIHEDTFIFHKIYAQVENICWINRALYVCRMSTNSITRTDGVYRTHPDYIDAMVDRLSFFQQYGNTTLVEAIMRDILRVFPDFLDDMEESKFKTLIAQTEQEIYRITKRRIFSLKFILLKSSPKFYLCLRKYYRIVKAALFTQSSKDNMV